MTAVNLGGVAALLLVSSLGWAQAERWKNVTLYRDSYGVPHAFGETWPDVLFAIGFAHAQDHAELTVRLARTVTGERASVVGPEAVQHDIYVHRLRVPDVAAEQARELEPELRELLQAFCDGFNLGVDQGPKRSGPLWRKLTIADLLAAIRYAMLSRAFSAASKELRAARGQLEASNMWIVSPKRSADGRVLFLSDPHLPWDETNRWYEVHMHCQGRNVYGITTPILPFVIIGFNDDICWGTTNNNPDVADCYILRLNPQNKNQYEYDGKWRDLVLREVTINVRGSEPHTAVLKYSHHGPVIWEDATHAVAARLATWDSPSAIKTLWKINMARSFEDVLEAFEERAMLRWNVFVGERRGRIAYLYNATTGLRPEGYDYTKPLPGWTSATEWRGVYPFDKLPRVIDPEAGFMQQCNTSPLVVCPNVPLRREDIPLYISSGLINPRGQRALDLFATKEKFTLQDIQRFATDTYFLVADDVLPALLSAYEAHATQIPDPQGHIKTAIEELKRWDKRGEIESRGATIFQLWWDVLDTKAKRAGNQGNLWTFFREQRQLAPRVQRIMLEALRDVVQFLVERYGSPLVPWGEVHRIRRGNVELPMAGGDKKAQVLYMGSGAYDERGLPRGGKLICSSGSSNLLTVAMGPQGIEAYTMRAWGQSENPASPHYADMTRLYSARQWKPCWITLEDIRAHLESVYPPGRN